MHEMMKIQVMFIFITCVIITAFCMDRNNMMQGIVKNENRNKNKNSYESLCLVEEKPGSMKLTGNWHLWGMKR